MKLPFGVTGSGIARELIVVAAAALIFAYLQRNSPTLRAWLSKEPNQ